MRRLLSEQSNMRSITDLLLHHRIPGIRLSETRHRCAEVLTRLLGTPIAAGNIQFDAGRLTLSIQPILKSALTLRRTELTAALHTQGIELKEVA